MINILEIPVIQNVFDLESEFTELLPVSSDRTYNGFRHIECKLSDEYTIFFYILDREETIANKYVWDRLIPKAPFCLFLISWDNAKLDAVYERYLNSYSTPLIFLKARGTEDQEAEKIDSKFLQDNKDKIVFYDRIEKKGILLALKKLIAGENDIVAELDEITEIDPE